ncbi:MAG: hypothetical protein ACQEP1_02130 [Nanobdellota archaeon]
MKLDPITKTREADEIPIAGFTLKELSKYADIGYRDKSTVPSVSNLKKDEPEKITYPHEVIIYNRKYLKENLEFMTGKKDIIREEGSCVHETAVLDTSEGPVYISEGAEIGPFCVIEGPVFIGKNSRINPHSKVCMCHIGNTCKVGGEIEESIICDYSNKQHLGYIGNSFIGSWVNIGAGTTNSDLKNTYGDIKVKDGEDNTINTGEQFIGCVIGDYSKTSINTSIYTGVRIGVNTHLEGTVKTDKGDFRMFGHDLDPEKAIEIQRRMFERRKKKQSEEDKNLLRRAHENRK